MSSVTVSPAHVGIDSEVGGSPLPADCGDLEQQLKNCYADLDVVLKHFGCSFDDVIVEDIFTTEMATRRKVSAY